jgi:Fe-S-cluster containining protein
VRVSDTEIAALAQRLEVSDEEFRAIYTRALRGGERSLRERRNRDCVFFDEKKGCTAYDDRPRQCRTWPFWRAVVHSREHWEETSAECPGMNSGPLYSAERIGQISTRDGTSGALRGPEKGG